MTKMETCGIVSETTSRYLREVIKTSMVACSPRASTCWYPVQKTIRLGFRPSGEGNPPADTQPSLVKDIGGNNVTQVRITGDRMDGAHDITFRRDIILTRDDEEDDENEESSQQTDSDDVVDNNDRGDDSG